MKEKGALVAVSSTAQCVGCGLKEADKVCTCGVPFCMNCFLQSGHAEFVHREKAGMESHVFD